MPTETPAEYKLRGYDLNPKRFRRAQYTGVSAFFSYGLSFVSHVVLLVGLALGVAGGISPNLTTVSLSQSSEAPDESVDLNSDFSVTTAPNIVSSEQPMAEESSFSNASEIKIDLPDLDQPLEPKAVSWKGELAKAVARDGAKKNGLSLSGSGSSFFGIESTGEKFVFVLDSSRSMAGKRWEHANKELYRSISELGPDQKFFVICFDYAAHPAFDLLPGNINFLAPSNNSRRRIRQWIQTLGLGSHTRPAEALKMALSLRPDAIYLLSDGELEDDSYDMLAILNHKPDTGETIIPINTISLFSTQGRELLQLIAANNGGKFVNVD